MRIPNVFPRGLYLNVAASSLSQHSPDRGQAFLLQAILDAPGRIDAWGFLGLYLPQRRRNKGGNGKQQDDEDAGRCCENVWTALHRYWYEPVDSVGTSIWIYLVDTEQSGQNSLNIVRFRLLWTFWSMYDVQNMMSLSHTPQVLSWNSRGAKDAGSDWSKVRRLSVLHTLDSCKVLQSAMLRD